MTASRRERLRALLREHDLGALLVTGPVNVRYLSGFTGSAGELLVAADGEFDAFVTDGRYAQQATREVPDVRCLVNPPRGWLADAIPAGTRLGLEAHAVSWERARAVQELLGGQVAAAPRLVERLRQVKDGDEIAALRAACDIADGAFAALTGWLRAGLTERQVAVDLERAMVDAGADDRSFSTIVASGPNSAVPHHRPTERELRRGDLVKVDFGAVVDGYHSDMTRMLALGDPGKDLADVFALVRQAQAAGLAVANDGEQTARVDAACREIIDAAGLGQRFVHGTGHGIGLQVHEDPFLRPDRPRPEAAASPSVTLRAGMTVTVEPGVYLPGVGGVRIEDALLVTRNGPDVLTRTPKDLVVL